MTLVQAIFFDLDNTIIDDESSYRLSLDIACDALAVERPGIDCAAVAAEYDHVSKAYWSTTLPTGLADRGNSRRELWQLTLDNCGLDDSQLAAYIAGLYSQARDETVTVYEETASVLQALQGRFRLAVITNGHGATQRRKLQLASLDSYFETIIASSEAGVAKPDRAVFDLALSSVGVSAAATWHVGDNLVADVGGAIDAGLRAAWINRTAAVRGPEHAVPHAEISSLNELLPLLESEGE